MTLQSLFILIINFKAAPVHSQDEDFLMPLITRPTGVPNAPADPDVLYHYTSEVSLKDIKQSMTLNPSVRSWSKPFIWCGNGVYVTDLDPSTGQEAIRTQVCALSAEAYVKLSRSELQNCGYAIVKGEEHKYIIADAKNGKPVALNLKTMRKAFGATPLNPWEPNARWGPGRTFKIPCVPGRRLGISGNPIRYRYCLESRKGDEDAARVGEDTSGKGTDSRATEGVDATEADWYMIQALSEAGGVVEMGAVTEDAVDESLPSKKSIGESAMAVLLIAVRLMSCSLGMYCIMRSIH